MKDLKLHRSAMEPVGIVAVVSMNTIWNRNMENAATSYASPERKNPFVPKRPNSLPNSLIVNSAFIVAPPPSVAKGPAPPIWRAKPHSQNPSMPRA